MAIGVATELLLEELLTPTRIIALSIVFTIASFIIEFTWQPRYPESIPRVGYGDGLVNTVKNWFGYVVYYNDWVKEGYEKYGKHNRSFIVPSAPSLPQEIVLPRSQTQWLLELPDRVMSTKEAHNDLLFTEYQMFGMDDQFPIRAVHKHLARSLPAAIPGYQCEIEASIDEAFGMDMEEWKTVNLWEAWHVIVPRATNRILVGAPTCRNKEFLLTQVGYADSFVRNSFILKIFPRPVHPIVARLLALLNWRHWRKGHKFLVPVIEKRLREMLGDQKEETTDPEDEHLITWLIRQAIAEARTDQLHPRQISQALLPVEFAAIHTTILTGHTLLLDVFGSDPKLNLLDVLREETSRVYREENGQWTKAGLSRLHRTDSAIRESMRVSTFSMALTHRKVMAPEGITNPTEGWHAPYGATLMLNMSCLQHDDDIYDDALTYDPFRFSRQREEFESRTPAPSASGKEEGAEKKDVDHDDSDEAMRIRRLGMITTSETHLPFSHGRHACPGRFFVAHEFKILLAYMLANYDIKLIPAEERPKPSYIGQTIVPPLGATVQVRRRKGTENAARTT